MSAERLVCTVATVEAIVRLAERYPVFPCRRNAEEVVIRGEARLLNAKSPYVTRGLYAASQDPGQIRAWWARWPDALVGVPTGSKTGLIVVDYDEGKIDAAASDWVQEHSIELLSTRYHGTLSGGRHYLFRAPPGIEYRNGVCLRLAGVQRNGIDLRAEGGYIIWWPLHGSNAGGEIAPLPAALVDEQRIETKDLPPLPEKTPESWARERQLVADALAYIDPSDYSVWMRAGLAIHLASGGSDDGFNLWHAWSAGEITGECPANYSGINDCRYHWASYRHDKARGGLVTLGTVFELARAKGYTSARQSPPEPPPLEAYADDERAAIQSEQQPAPKKNRKPMRWLDLAGQTPPERKWRLSHWLGWDEPTLMAGAGGIGKTLLAQTLGTALAFGKPFLDQVFEPINVLIWACEDHHDELWRRQVAICRYFDIPLEALEGRLIIEPRRGLENTLFDLAYGAPVWTPLRDELREQIQDYNAKVFFLDNIGQSYGGKENDRHQVTTFCNGLAGIAPECASVIMGHPAKTADSEFSGSTAWENAVRMRWYMGYKLPDQEVDKDETQDPNVRYIAKRKANYSEKDYRKLVWRDGLFQPEFRNPALGPPLSPAVRMDSAKACVLAALDRFALSSIRVTDGRTSPDYMPKKMREMNLTHEHSARELADALSQLRLSGQVIEGQIGKYGNRTSKVGLIRAQT